MINKKRKKRDLLPFLYMTSGKGAKAGGGSRIVGDGIVFQLLVKAARPNNAVKSIAVPKVVYCMVQGLIAQTMVFRIPKGELQITVICLQL